MSSVVRVLGQFDANREAVRSMMHFDKAVLEIVVRRLETLNEKWMGYLLRDAKPDKSRRLPKPNPQYTADGLIRSLETIRENDSLRVNYDLMLNQCLVLLVSFFGSAARALCEELLIRALRRTPIRRCLSRTSTLPLETFEGSARIGS